MLRIRLEEDRNAYRCCFCCHVTTGTILLGLWHLVIQMTVLIMFFVMVMHPELELPSPATGGAFGGPAFGHLSGHEGVPNPSTATEQSTPQETKMFDSIMSLYLDNNNAGEDMETQEKHVQTDNGFNASKLNWHKRLQLKLNTKTPTAEDKCVGAAVTTSSLVITIMLIFGTARGRPGYLMPFFCLQAFDFCISCLTVVGYLSYMPDIKLWIKSQPELPFKENLLQMAPQSLDLLTITFFFLVVLVKAYFLGVVWATYKYLANRLASPDQPGSERLRGPLYYPVMSSGHDCSRRNLLGIEDGDSEDQSDQPEGAPLLPPKYEDAIKMPVSAPSKADENQVPPPPPYTPFAPGLF